MKKINTGINGFGRIGRTVFRKIMEHDDIEVVAINDLTAPSTLAHLLKYDSIHGGFKGTVSSGDDYLLVNGIKIPVYAQKDPAQIPWGKHETAVVVESTGKFTKVEDAALHLKGGAKKVIISSPGKGNLKSVVLGVNENILDGNETVISNASCTTNNAAPMIKVLNDKWGIETAFITTIHAYTGDQNLHDAPHKDLRRARAAALSIIPTTTGAAKAITDIFPEMKGRIGGAGIRVPVPNGSLTDITCILTRPAQAEEINAAFKIAAETNMKGIIQYTEDPIVSVDIIDNPFSCIFDSLLTSAMGKMVKVVGWYDNESGYSARLVELIIKWVGPTN